MDALAAGLRLARGEVRAFGRPVAYTLAKGGDPVDLRAIFREEALPVEAAFSGETRIVPRRMARMLESDVPDGAGRGDRIRHTDAALGDQLDEVTELYRDGAGFMNLKLSRLALDA